MEVEPRVETESRRARVTLCVQRAKAELTTHVTEAEVGPGRPQQSWYDCGQRWSRREGGDKGKEERGNAGGAESSTNQGGARGTREPVGTSGMMVHGGDEGAGSQGGAVGSEG